MSKKRELPPLPPKKVKKSTSEKVSEKDNKKKSKKVKDNTDEDPTVDPAATVENAEPKTRAPRKKPTMEDHIGNYNKILTMLDEEIDRKSREKEKGVRTFRKVKKILIKMRKELPVVARSKAARIKSSNSGKMGGIMIKYQISKELADFLQVPHDTKLSRVETTRAICAYSHLKEDEKREGMLAWVYLNPDGKRNLQNPLDHKAILPDKALSKLLRYDQYKKDVKAGKITKNMKDKETGKVIQVKMSDDMLYYWVIQRLVGVHFVKT